MNYGVVADLWRLWTVALLEAEREKNTSELYNG